MYLSCFSQKIIFSVISGISFKLSHSEIMCINYHSKGEIKKFYRSKFKFYLLYFNQTDAQHMYKQLSGGVYWYFVVIGGGGNYQP